MTIFPHLHPGISTRHKSQQSLTEDFVFVMDSSESVGSCEFGKAQKAPKYMMRLANVGGSDAKYEVSS